MSIGGFSLLVDGYSKGLHDRIAQNKETDDTITRQLGNLYGITTFPDRVQQVQNDTDLSTLNRLYSEDIYTLNQLAFPGQMARSFMMGEAMPWFTFGDLQNQFAQQAWIYQNMPSFLAMMGGQGRMPSGAYNG